MQKIWKLPTSELWDIVLGAVTVDTDETVNLARLNLRARGEIPQDSVITLDNTRQTR